MENELPKGIIFKKPREGAPDFVRGSLSFKVDEFITYLTEKKNNGWVNIDILKSKAGKTYLKLNDWKPKQEVTGLPAEESSVRQAEIDEYNSIPF